MIDKHADSGERLRWPVDEMSREELIDALRRAEFYCEAYLHQITVATAELKGEQERWARRGEEIFALKAALRRAKLGEEL